MGFSKGNSVNHLHQNPLGVGPGIFICNKLPRIFTHTFKVISTFSIFEGVRGNNYVPLPLGNMERTLELESEKTDFLT